MQHLLPDLPYSKDSLRPYISAETLSYHHGKHHKGYVEKLNELINGTKFVNMSLVEIIQSSDEEIFNNAAQSWNHDFFWKCLRPDGGGAPSGKIEKLINKKWPDFENFKQDFSQAAINNFGSGWTWLVQKGENNIEIYNTSNADTPIAHGLHALLTLDVWEHAYYIDHRNDRKQFVNGFWNLVNWDFVNKNLEWSGEVSLGAFT